MNDMHNSIFLLPYGSTLPRLAAADGALSFCCQKEIKNTG